MSRQIWSRERIIEEIERLHSSGFDISQSRMESIDSRLTSAAIRYFGSWRTAVESAGIDYESVAALGKQRRAEKITKWTKDKILDEIRRLYKAGEDLTSTVIRRKNLSLYATARRKDHFGSWAAALSEAGIDYSGLKKASREKRKSEIDWKAQLLADYYASPSLFRNAQGMRDEDAESQETDWARELIRERIVEMYERAESNEVDRLKQLQALIHREAR